MSCYVHNLPGRLRVRIPAVKGKPAKAEKLINQLNALAGVTSVAANPVTVSILIRYDSATINAEACLAFLHIPVPGISSPSRTRRLTSKMAEAAIWYVLEKTLERCFLLILAALF